jgi:hypothetical protein
VRSNKRMELTALRGGRAGNVEVAAAASRSPFGERRRRSSSAVLCGSGTDYQEGNEPGLAGGVITALAGVVSKGCAACVGVTALAVLGWPQAPRHATRGFPVERARASSCAEKVR